MSTQPEALRLADALDHEFAQGRISNYNGRKAATELRRLHEALETKQEPVAWMHTTGTGHVYFRKKPQDKVFNPQPVYTSPKREWVGLTADEIWQCNKASGSAVEFHICYEHQNVLDFAESLEAKLREKNT